MATQGTGDNSAGSSGNTTKLPQRPPKSPSFGNIASNVSDSINNPSIGWSSFPLQNNSLKHQCSPSMGYLSHGEPSWIDDLIQSSLETPTRKVAHRRSASDSLAFLEAPANSTADNGELDFPRVASISPRASPDFEKLEEEQLMSMFVDMEPYQKPKNHSDESLVPAPSAFEGACSEKQALVSTSDNLSSTSDHNSINEPSMEDMRMNGSDQFKNEPEVQSSCKGDHPLQPVKTEPPTSMPLESTMDPKRIKRIIANRQSAQRSRVRKLHYISELERSVNALQTEVSAISPQVAYLDHQRAILKIDNSTLKERIAMLVQDKIFKDAHGEVLKAEVQMLRQLYQQQHMQHQQQHMEQEMTSNVLFDMHQQNFGKIEIAPSLQREPKADVSGSPTDILRNAEGKFDNKRNGGPPNHCSSVSHISKGLMTTSCPVAETNKNLEAGNTPFSSDYMVQNP